MERSFYDKRTMLNYNQHNIMERSFYDKRTMLHYCLLALLLQVPQYPTHGFKTKIICYNCNRFLDCSWRSLVMEAAHEIGELNVRAPARARASGEAAPFPAKGPVEQGEVPAAGSSSAGPGHSVHDPTPFLMLPSSKRPYGSPTVLEMVLSLHYGLAMSLLRSSGLVMCIHMRSSNN